VTGWCDVTLGDVLTLQRGFDLPARDRVDGPYPIVSSSGVTGRHAVAKVQPPGVVIGRYGSLGSVHWVTEPYWPLNTALWVKDFKGNDPRFLSYLLHTVTVDGSTASAVPGVNRNHLHRLPVRIPRLVEQRRISVVLAAFDELIESNERRIELLESLARSLYREWFVRLRAPTVEAESGELPYGWQLTDLGSIARWYSGGTPSTKNDAYWDGGIPWITSGCLRTVLLSESDRTLTSAGVAAGSRIVDRDAVLFVVRGMSLIREVRAGIAERELAFGQDCKALVAVDGVEPSFLAFTVLDRQTAMHGMVELAGHGTGKLSTDRIKALPVALPPLAVQRQFANAVTPIRAGIAAAMDTARALAHTRDLLLPRLVSGRLDLSGVDLSGLAVAEEAG
jgi:type I restriction enzyme S subunit